MCLYCPRRSDPRSIAIGDRLIPGPTPFDPLHYSQVRPYSPTLVCSRGRSAMDNILARLPPENDALRISKNDMELEMLAPGNQDRRVLCAR